MEFKAGDIVEWKLTKEKFIVLGITTRFLRNGLWLICQGEDKRKVFFAPFEVDKYKTTKKRGKA